MEEEQRVDQLSAAIPILPDPEFLTAHDRMTWVNEVRARLVAKEAVSEEEIRHAIKMLGIEREEASKRAGKKKAAGLTAS